MKLGSDMRIHLFVDKSLEIAQGNDWCNLSASSNTMYTCLGADEGHDAGYALRKDCNSRPRSASLNAE